MKKTRYIIIGAIILVVGFIVVFKTTVTTYPYQTREENKELWKPIRSLFKRKLTHDVSSYFNDKRVISGYSDSGFNICIHFEKVRVPKDFNLETQIKTVISITKEIAKDSATGMGSSTRRHDLKMYDISFEPLKEIKILLGEDDNMVNYLLRDSVLILSFDETESNFFYNSKLAGFVNSTPKVEKGFFTYMFLKRKNDLYIIFTTSKRPVFNYLIDFKRDE